MTGSHISVSFAALQEAQQGIARTYSSLVSTLETLERELNPMVTTWTGSAQQAYHEKKQAWDTAAAALSQVLNQIGQAVGEANENYQAAEHANRNAWS
jgi:WXG100 family type VII secretion target